jgi:hypothetical protein
MGNHTRVQTPRSPAAQRPTVLARVAGGFASIIDWLRAGYPDDAPATGYSPLLALNGPISLSARQTVQIVEDLRGADTDPIDIGVAITKTTHRLPTDAQTRTVTEALASAPPRSTPSH